MIEIITGKLVSDSVLASHKHSETHTQNAHTDSAREPLLEAHGLSTKQRQPPKSIENNEGR